MQQATGTRHWGETRLYVQAQRGVEKRRANNGSCSSQPAQFHSSFPLFVSLHRCNFSTDIDLSTKTLSTFRFWFLRNPHVVPHLLVPKTK